MQGDILLGPSVLGRNKAFRNHVFPMESLTVLNMLANIGLLLFLFLYALVRVFSRGMNDIRQLISWSHLPLK